MKRKKGCMKRVLTTKIKTPLLFQTRTPFPNIECFYHPSLTDKAAIFSDGHTEKHFNFHFMPINLLHIIRLLARKKIKNCIFSLAGPDFIFLCKHCNYFLNSFLNSLSAFSQVDIFSLAPWKKWHRMANPCLTISSSNHLDRFTNTFTQSIISSQWHFILNYPLLLTKTKIFQWD
jgi:hypothetical protein